METFEEEKMREFLEKGRKGFLVPVVLAIMLGVGYLAFWVWMLS